MFIQWYYGTVFTIKEIDNHSKPNYFSYVTT